MEVIENVYTNKQFYSEVNDFEDEYHEPDKDYSTNDDIMNNLIERLRSQKRKYTNFQQWCEAKEVYIEYTKRLIAKYGGRKKFKLLANIGMIDDYVPYCPKLKRNRKNKTYVTTKDLPYIPEFKASEDFIDKIVITDEDLDAINCKIDVKITNSEINVKKVIGMDEIEKNINNDLMKIETYYRGRVRKLTRRKKREQEAKIRKDFLKPENQEMMSFSDLMKKYNKRKDLGLYVEDMQEEIQRIKYRDVAYGPNEEAEIEFLDILEKDIGISVGREIISKKSMKVIRKRDGKHKPKKKKGKGIKRDKHMKKMAKNNYASMESFTRDLSELTSSVLEREGIL